MRYSEYKSFELTATLNGWDRLFAHINRDNDPATRMVEERRG